MHLLSVRGLWPRHGRPAGGATHGGAGDSRRMRRCLAALRADAYVRSWLRPARNARRITRSASLTQAASLALAASATAAPAATLAALSLSFALTLTAPALATSSTLRRATLPHKNILQLKGDSLCSRLFFPPRRRRVPIAHHKAPIRCWLHRQPVVPPLLRPFPPWTRARAQ